MQGALETVELALRMCVSKMVMQGGIVDSSSIDQNYMRYQEYLFSVLMIEKHCITCGKDRFIKAGVLPSDFQDQ